MPSPDPPLIDLVFAIEGDVSDEAARAMERTIAELGTSRPWTIAPPAFIDDVDTSSCTDPGDEPIVTVGGMMRLYAAYPPWRESLSAAIDRAQYREVEAVVGAMSRLSATLGLTIVVEYDGELVGAIEHGIPDESLREGLLGEWNRILEQLERAPVPSEH